MTAEHEHTPKEHEAKARFVRGTQAMFSKADAVFGLDTELVAEAEWGRLIESIRAVAKAEQRETDAQIADEVDRDAERDLGIEYNGHAAEVAARIRAGEETRA